MMDSSRRFSPVVAAALALAACDARSGNEAAPAGNGSAANKAEEGQISISAPGVNMTIDVPEGLRREAQVNDGIVYPGSNVSGVHVQSGGGDGNPDGEVELRFASDEALDRVARWYLDPARAGDFVVASSGREGEAWVFAGTARDRSRFRIRLTPRAGGGVEGRALIADE